MRMQHLWDSEHLPKAMASYATKYSGRGGWKVYLSRFDYDREYVIAIKDQISGDVRAARMNQDQMLMATKDEILEMASQAVTALVDSLMYNNRGDWARPGPMPEGAEPVSAEVLGEAWGKWKALRKEYEESNL